MYERVPHSVRRISRGSVRMAARPKSAICERGREGGREGGRERRGEPVGAGG